MISVLIPILEPEPRLQTVLKRVELIRNRYPGLILEVLQDRSKPLCKARRALIDQAQAPVIFNLDADNMVPLEYPVRALDILNRDPHVGAVALNYKHRPSHHLGFGMSIIRRKILAQLYDWPGPEKSGTCECRYMWQRIDAAGWILATLPMTAERLKPRLK